MMTKSTREALAQVLIALGDRLIRLGCSWADYHVIIDIAPEHSAKHQRRLPMPKVTQD